LLLDSTLSPPLSKDSDVSAGLLLGELREIIDPRLYPSHAKSFKDNARTAFHNFGSVANQRDVVKDTFNTFVRNAKRYFDVGDFLGLDIEERAERVR
jgi:hypothetical protein